MSDVERHSGKLVTDIRHFKFRRHYLYDWTTVYAVFLVSLTNDFMPGCSWSFWVLWKNIGLCHVSVCTSIFSSSSSLADLFLRKKCYIWNYIVCPVILNDYAQFFMLYFHAKQLIVFRYECLFLENEICAFSQQIIYWSICLSFV